MAGTLVGPARRRSKRINKENVHMQTKIVILSSDLFDFAERMDQEFAKQLSEMVNHFVSSNILPKRTTVLEDHLC